MCSKPVSRALLLLIALASPSLPVQLQVLDISEPAQPESLEACLGGPGRARDAGTCLGGELLARLRRYDQADTFSFGSGVSFVRDEATPRDFDWFLDKDPSDYRSILESASSLISKRSLHWDMSRLYPGLVMRVGPTLANGVLEFVMDPKIHDRTFQGSEELSTGRLLAKNLMLPLLLGFKFQLSTLLPLLLGLLLLASKKAFLLAKLAVVAATVFGGAGALGGAFGGGGAFSGGGAGFSNPVYSSAYTSGPAHYHAHQGGFYNRPPPEPYFREKSAEPTTASPITPTELRDRFERLFITKSEINQPRDEDGRHFAWSPVVG